MLGRQLRHTYVKIAAALSAVAMTGLSANVALAQSNPPERLVEPTTITEISGADIHLHTIAKDTGILEKYNITLNENLATVGGVALMPIMVSGQANTTDPGISATIIARSTGAPVTAVAAGYMAGGDVDTSRFYVRADSPIKTAKDLEGKRVAIMSIGSTPDIALAVWLGKNGADSAQVQRVAIPYANMMDALEHDQVDAISLVGVFYRPLEKSDKASQVRLLFRDRDGLPTDKLFLAYAFTNEYIAQHPDVVKAFIAAIKETAVWVVAHPEETVEIVSKHYKLPAENLALPAWPKNLCIDKAAAEEWAAALLQVGQIKKDSLPATDEWITNKFNPDCPQ